MHSGNKATWYEQLWKNNAYQWEQYQTLSFIIDSIKERGLGCWENFPFTRLNDHPRIISGIRGVSLKDTIKRLWNILEWTKIQGRRERSDKRTVVWEW